MHYRELIWITVYGISNGERQWRRQLENWGGGEYSYLLLKSIVFMVCEHKWCVWGGATPPFITDSANVS